MNISGTLNVVRLIRDPTLCLPHHTVSTFNHLPVPLSKAFATRDGEKGVDIRAVVLDKDNCFAVPHKNEVHTPYNVLNGFCPNRIYLLFKSCVIFQHSSCFTVIGDLYLVIRFLLIWQLRSKRPLPLIAPLKDKFQELRKTYPGSRLLIVSNTAGTLSDRGYAEAEALERNTGVKVLRHNTKVCPSILISCHCSDNKLKNTRNPGAEKKCWNISVTRQTPT